MEIAAEFLATFFGDQFETGGLINVPRGEQLGVGPQREAPIAFVARKADRFVDQPAADAQTARLRIDVKQRSLATSSEPLESRITNIEPTTSPQRSAIQQRSRR